MSLLFYRQGLLSTRHHGNFPGNGPRAETQKTGKSGKGSPWAPRDPQRAPEGPVGNHTGPYRTIASSPEVRLNPRTPRPRSDPSIFSENPTSISDGIRRFLAKIRHFRNFPRIHASSAGCPQVHTDRSGLLWTHTGTRNCLPGQFIFFPLSGFPV